MDTIKITPEFRNWFESRGLRVLNYQVDAIDKVQESLSQSKTTILAACPSSGKTHMSVYIIEEYLREHPGNKILVLAHGTTVLRTQFHDVLKETNPDFTYNLVETFSEYDNNAAVNVCLPQTLHRHKLPKIDLIIVDEAHHFYFATMVETIIQKIKPKKQLLLTGTPSPFILRGMEIIPVTLNTIIDEGMISDLYVEIATSSYGFDPFNDYNDDDELKKDVAIKAEETKKTLDNLLSKIVNKLKRIPGNEYQNLQFTWLPTLTQMQKTMIACRSQAQAKQVKHYFDRYGIKSSLSISDLDYDSDEIEAFKRDPDILILIVVARGILGFNYPELVNIVDMTTSQNINRIYQLLCRVIRKHPKGKQKLFFKIAPSINSDYYEYIMTAALSLSNENFITKFNGKNFNEMPIPIIKLKQEEVHRQNSEPAIKNGNRERTFKPIDFTDIFAFEFFRNVYYKKDSILDVLAYTTMMDVRAQFAKHMPKFYWTKERCLESALKYKVPSEWIKNDASAYNATRKNGWLPECTAHMNRMLFSKGYWTKERCLESALRYQTHKEWKKNDLKAYSAAKCHGWFDECTAHLEKKQSFQSQSGYWTKEKCMESAGKYQTSTEWRKNDPKAYVAAKNHEWFDECTAHLEKKQSFQPGYWTKEKCMESAGKYQTSIEWRKNDPKAYQAAARHSCLDECSAHMVKCKIYDWTKERCLESALRYQTHKEWKKNDPKACVAALRHKWLTECKEHMGYSTKEKCMESAGKYQTSTEWKKNDPKAYSAAQRHKWLTECTSHMKKMNNWTKEKCMESASKYQTIREWAYNNSGAYGSSLRNSWLLECTAHMKRLKK